MNNPWLKIEIPVVANQINGVGYGKHPLDLKWALDSSGNYLFIVDYPVSQHERPKRTPEILGIKTKITKKDSDNDRLILTLTDKDDWELFYKLCLDLVEKTKKIKNTNKATSVVFMRLKRWQEFLRSNREILSESRIKGLIGELVFLNEHLSQHYDLESAINFWEGPSGAPQDFGFSNISVEVKCRLGTTNPRIEITSLNQLNSSFDKKYLFVVTLSKSDFKSDHHVTLNSIVEDVQNKLLEDGVSELDRFQDQLMHSGYTFHPKYDEYIYEVVRYDIFEVKDGFPRIQSSDLHSGITSVKYQILLKECEDYKIKDIEWMN